MGTGDFSLQVKKELIKVNQKQIIHLPKEQLDLPQIFSSDFLLPIDSKIFLLIENRAFRRWFLRMAFLELGKISDPIQAYRIEFKTTDVALQNLLLQALAQEGITKVTLSSKDASRVYFNQAEQVSDFLAFIGAHQSLLLLENQRVEKDMHNTINRMVNFDTANLERQAQAWSRQIYILKEFLDGSSGQNLSEELKKTVRLRIDNPGMSLAEIGQLLDPPLSKSGVYHRLQTVEKMAKQPKEEG